MVAAIIGWGKGLQFAVEADVIVVVPIPIALSTAVVAIFRPSPHSSFGCPNGSEEVNEVGRVPLCEVRAAVWEEDQRAGDASAQGSCAGQTEVSEEGTVDAYNKGPTKPTFSMLRKTTE